MTYLEELRGAIRKLHGCEATHKETVPVKEVFQGKTVWEGEVEVFELDSHPEASRCYAWAHAAGIGDREKRFVTVLEIPPVNSPRTAVQVAVLEESKRLRKRSKN